MAHDLAYWQARVDLLENAITSGSLSVRHGDTQLTYRSLDELRFALNFAQGKIKALDGTGGRKPGYVLQTSKGLTR